MEDVNVKIGEYFFKKHEGTLIITPQENESRILQVKYNEANDAVDCGYDDEFEELRYWIEHYPVDTPEEVIDVLSLAIQLNLTMGLSLNEYNKLCEFSVNQKAQYKTIDEVDLRETQFLPLDCKIKNIQQPRVETGYGQTSGEYVQYVELYDDNTSKTIKTLFGNRCAKFDTWKNGDCVRLIGRYSPRKYRKGTIQLIVSDAIKIEESDEPVTITREEEIAGYNKWRDTILSKDNQECVCCGLDKHLEAHHLYGYKEHPELAVDPDNGVTLCSFCHKKYHSIYGLRNINPRDFIDFIRRFGV